MGVVVWGCIRVDWPRPRRASPGIPRALNVSVVLGLCAPLSRCERGRKGYCSAPESDDGCDDGGCYAHASNHQAAELPLCAFEVRLYALKIGFCREVTQFGAKFDFKGRYPTFDIFHGCHG